MTVPHVCAAAVAAASVLVAAAPVSGCSGSRESGPVRVAPPTPAARVAPLCSRLHERLPERLDEDPLVPVTPRTTYAAAWGEPAIVLRCGVDAPRAFRGTSEVIEVNGVAWFLVETDASYVFTSVGRQAFVEVRVPSSVPRQDATAPLVDLARPITRCIPVSPSDG